jgi:beta-lactam-binding protein with PASTA domain
MDPLIILFIAGAIAAGFLIWKSFPSDSERKRPARLTKTEEAARKATEKNLTKKQQEQAKREREKLEREEAAREKKRLEEAEGDAVGIGTGVGGVAGDVIGLGDGMKD